MEVIGNKKCCDIIRMGPGAFLDLCDMLCKEGGLQPTQRATIEEQVAKFLYILSHGVKHREISFFFRRSGETINRHFHQVLRSVIQLEEKFLVVSHHQVLMTWLRKIENIGQLLWMMRLLMHSCINII